MTNDELGIGALENWRIGFRLVISVLCWVLILSGCMKRPQINRPETAAAAFDQARKDKDAGRFSQAEDGFTYVIFNFPGTNEAADAQFQLADCYFLSKDYLQAQTEFDFYLKNFPNGRYQEEAAFKLAMATLRSAPGPDKDQTSAIRARELFEEFLERYPESKFQAQVRKALSDIAQRLAHKEFEAARLYLKAGEFRSALVYYEFISNNYPDIHWSVLDRYRWALCYYHTGQPEKARPLFEDILTADAAPKLIQSARGYLNRLR